MKNLPYAVLPAPALRTVSRPLLALGDTLQRHMPSLKDQLRQADVAWTAHEYLAAALASDILLLVVLGAVLSLPLGPVLGILLAIVITMMIMFQQVMFPRVIIARKVAHLEAQLLPALRDLLVQLNAGVPFYDALRHIAMSGYGEVSHEFGKAVASISAGELEPIVLQRLADDNPSPYFRRAVWQLANSMKAGSDVGDVLEDIIASLADEQLMQLQEYGGQLNPLAMLYLLFAIIVPSLGVTFVVLFSSLVKVETFTLHVIFIGIFCALVIFQVIFIGVVKARRPHLI